MGIEPPWLALAAVMTVINASILGFMAWKERAAALGLWAYAWLAWAVALIPMAGLHPERPHPLLALAAGACWLVSSLCFLAGTYAFAERRMPRGWLGVAALCLAAAMALTLGPLGARGIVPLVVFQCVGLMSAAVLIVRSARQRAGAWLSGGALAILALHILDAPIAAANPELAPWGFVLSAALEVLAALGMLMLYYEHATARFAETATALEETRRAESLGRIAGGVAHDFNNLLTVMQGNMDLIALRGIGGGETKGLLDAIRNSIGQASRLTAQLLAFGRRSVIRSEPVDVRKVAADTLSLLRNVIPENITLSFECGEDVQSMCVDRALLEQVVLNLVTNARDAIDGEGHIRVELESVQVPREGIRLRVTDDGSGMEPDVASRVFEPFFTTKETGKGTGLGLASVQGAVTQLGGTIVVRTSVGQGSVFEVLFPSAPVTRASRSVPVSESDRQLDVLLVDDDDRVRDVTAKLLESGGHRVVVAADGLEGLDLARQRYFDVVVSDVVMPRMGGVSLTNELSTSNPELPVVLTSGYPLGEDVDTRRVHFLAKPLERQALLALLARVAGERRTAQEGGAGH